MHYRDEGEVDVKCSLEVDKVLEGESEASVWMALYTEAILNTWRVALLDQRRLERGDGILKIAIGRDIKEYGLETERSKNDNWWFGNCWQLRNGSARSRAGSANA